MSCVKQSEITAKVRCFTSSCSWYERMDRCLIVRPVVPLSSVLNNKRIVLSKVSRYNDLSVNQLLLLVFQECRLLFCYKVMSFQRDEALGEVVDKNICLANNCFQASSVNRNPCLVRDLIDRQLIKGSGQLALQLVN